MTSVRRPSGSATWPQRSPAPPGPAAAVTAPARRPGATGSSRPHPRVLQRHDDPPGDVVRGPPPIHEVRAHLLAQLAVALVDALLPLARVEHLHLRPAH